MFRIELMIESKVKWLSIETLVLDMLLSLTDLGFVANVLNFSLPARRIKVTVDTHLASLSLIVNVKTKWDLEYNLRLSNSSL